MQRVTAVVRFAWLPAGPLGWSPQHQMHVRVHLGLRQLDTHARGWDAEVCMEAQLHRHRD